MTTGENGTGDGSGGGSWDADHLMHHSDPGKAPESPTTMRKRLSIRPSARKLKSKSNDPSMWGMPGELTKEEVDVYMKFRDEVQKRDSEFRDTIYSFGEEEGEAYALCRWLRARKFVYDDVIKMVEEATECRAEAKSKGFYPDAVEALGCDASMFFSQYPQFYHENAKNGAVLYISKPGSLNVDAMEIVTSLEGILRYHWHAMMIDFKERLREKKRRDPEFVRFECFCVLDLEHLTASSLSQRALAIIKEQSFIDSLCFPETMSKMIIVNAPRFFAATWRLIKGWIDARTASKVEVLSGRGAWEKRLREYVPEESLPLDYGGKGPDSNKIILSTLPGGRVRQLAELMYVRGHASHTVEIKAGEVLEIDIYTRSLNGGSVSITDADHKKGKEPIAKAVEVKHNDEDVSKPATRVGLTPSRLPGPAHVKVKIDSNAGRFTTERFLLDFSFYPN